MNSFSLKETTGHIIDLKRTDPRHLSSARKQNASTYLTDSPERGFGKLFFEAMNQVNNLQQNSMRLTQQMITDPESVNVHDITIALAKANLSLSMTRAIMDRALSAYRQIISIR